MFFISVFVRNNLLPSFLLFAHFPLTLILNLGDFAPCLCLFHSSALNNSTLLFFFLPDFLSKKIKNGFRISLIFNYLFVYRFSPLSCRYGGSPRPIAGLLLLQFQDTFYFSSLLGLRMVLIYFAHYSSGCPIFFYHLQFLAQSIA